MKELEREPKRLRKMSREARWGKPIRLLTCDFCGWQGSELQADKEFEDNDDCDFEPSGWELLCPECGSGVGFAASDPNEPEEWSVNSPWDLKPAAGLAKRPREVPPQDPADPTDSALEYEVNTGFLDPYRGNISTPEGWGPKRGQPAPRLKKKDKSPVMPADMPIYARRREMRKLADIVDGLTDEQLAQKFMDALDDELGFIDSWSPETAALRTELDARGLEVDFWVSLDVMDSEGHPIFQEGG